MLKKALRVALATLALLTALGGSFVTVARAECVATPGGVVCTK